MTERPIEQLTLRDMFTNAEWLLRDLTAHLNQAFRPKSRAVIELVQSRVPEERDAVADSSVRSNMATLLGSDDYSQNLFRKLDSYLAAIDERAEGAITTK